MTIDEKLAMLQGLFLQRAAIDDQIKQLVGNGGVDIATEAEEEPGRRKTAKGKAAKRKVGK